jgi:hypothetical protein
MISSAIKSSELLKSCFNYIQIFSGLNANKVIALSEVYNLCIVKKVHISPIVLHTLSSYSLSATCEYFYTVYKANDYCMIILSIRILQIQEKLPFQLLRNVNIKNMD